SYAIVTGDGGPRPARNANRRGQTASENRASPPILMISTISKIGKIGRSCDVVVLRRLMR
ncbi:MAG TPA: hypothetical protein VEZ90_09635, partial [Blastocatellia bacterium]|nr:hypothetical protein [Blastocatellia bacterium]